jgi:hypothetical protein
MNANPRIAVITAAAMAGSWLPLSAAVAVISNLGQPGQPSTALRSFSGVPLPAGTGVSLVTFPGKSAAEIRALAAGGIPSLLSAAVFFGESSVVGEGSNQVAGLFEFRTGAPLVAPLDNPHVLVSKGSTELLLLRLPRAIPADDLAGPESHIGIHLDDAEAVYGSRDATGFATAVSPEVVQTTPFEAWILSELGEETPEVDLLPEADADRDGVVNLMEYAAGSDPGDGGSRGQVRLRRSAGGTYFFQYLRRTGDPSLAYTAERLGDEGAGPWIALEGTPTAPAEAPVPAPAAFEWVEQPLPSGTSGFARLRVELVAP